MNLARPENFFAAAAKTVGAKGRGLDKADHQLQKAILGRALLRCQRAPPTAGTFTRRAAFFQVNFLDHCPTQASGGGLRGYPSSSQFKEATITRSKAKAVQKSLHRLRRLAPGFAMPDQHRR